jgi:hypothetical protein
MVEKNYIKEANHFHSTYFSERIRMFCLEIGLNGGKSCQTKELY